MLRKEEDDEGYDDAGKDEEPILAGHRAVSRMRVGSNDDGGSIMGGTRGSGDGGGGRGAIYVS